MKTRYWIVIGIAGIIFTLMSAYHYWALPKKGDPAPAFKLTDISGRTVSLEDYRGQVVLLHFWATWCSVCRYEIPSLNRLNQKLKGRGLAVISILEDGEGARALTGFAPLTFPVLLDPKGLAADEYMVYGVPESFIVDGDGVISARFSGGINWDTPEQLNYFERLLQK